MEPPELAIWLLSFYGEAYRDDIDIAREIAKDTLVRLESVARQEVNFCTIYALNTCFKVSSYLQSILQVVLTELLLFVFKSLTEQFPPEEGYRVARCYDFKFNDRGMNFIKPVTVPTTQCIIAMDPSPAQLVSFDLTRMQ